MMSFVNGRKIYLRGAKPSILKYGGLGHRPLSHSRDWCLLMFVIFELLLVLRSCTLGWLFICFPLFESACASHSLTISTQAILPPRSNPPLFRTRTTLLSLALDSYETSTTGLGAVLPDLGSSQGVSWRL